VPDVRPSNTVVRLVLTIILALGALPGLAGANNAIHEPPNSAASFRNVILAAARERPTRANLAFQSADSSAGVLDASTTFVERGVDAPSVERVAVKLPAVAAAWDWKPPKSTIEGEASFYSNGTTAMRLPRGTTVVICGKADCIERVINDYGPTEATGRIVDLYKPDFFKICGCPSWSGTTQVTIRVY
jgi:hypothetical protein